MLDQKLQIDVRNQSIWKSLKDEIALYMMSWNGSSLAAGIFVYGTFLLEIPPLLWRSFSSSGYLLCLIVAILQLWGVVHWWNLYMISCKVPLTGSPLYLRFTG